MSAQLVKLTLAKEPGCVWVRADLVANVRDARDAGMTVPCCWVRTTDGDKILVRGDADTVAADVNAALAGE